jgi:LysR family nod box-dependent transcriptional activator
MRFKGLDLNLLVAFDTLLELRNVSRAADRLGLTQPAMSAALSRLREYFADELLTLDGKRLQPTPFAENLIPQVRALLNAAESVVATSAGFSPATAVRTFRIVASDYVVATVLASVARRLVTVAPSVRLEFVLPDEIAAKRLERGELDLMITPAEFLVESQPSELLYEESHVIAGCRENPIFRTGVTAAAIFAAGHVAVSMGPHRVTSFGDRQIEQIEPDRRIEAVASSFAVLPWLLVGTERLALMHERLAVLMAQHVPIAFAPLPFPFPMMREMLQYHRARSADEGLRWLISEIRSITALYGS